MPHQPARVGACHQQRRAQQAHRQPPIHLPHADGLRVQAARLPPGRLPEQTQRRDRHAAAYKAHHGAMPLIRQPDVNRRRRHAQRKRIQISGELIKVQAHVVIRRRNIPSRRQRKPDHRYKRQRGPPSERACQQRKEQIELHFQRQRPQRAAEIRGVVGIIGKHLRIGQVADQIAQQERPVRAIGVCRQRHAKHHRNRQ